MALHATVVTKHKQQHMALGDIFLPWQRLVSQGQSTSCYWIIQYPFHQLFVYTSGSVILTLLHMFLSTVKKQNCTIYKNS
jgi:hypothetical protein